MDRAFGNSIHQLKDVKLRGKIPTEDDSQSSEGSNRYEKLLDNFTKELRDYDNEHELELQKAHEQCERLKSQLQTTEEELTKTNDLLSAEKIFRSKAELERDTLAYLAEKLELILLKCIPTDSQSEDLIKRYEKLLQDNFATELHECDSREKIETLELDLQSANNESQQVEVKRDSLAGLTEKLEIILLRYDQHFSAAATKMVEFIDLPNVMFSNELDLNENMDFECDTKDVLKLSPPATTNVVKNTIAEEISLPSAKICEGNIQFAVPRKMKKKLSAKTTICTRSQCTRNARRSKEKAKLLMKPKVRPLNMKDSNLRCIICRKDYSSENSLNQHKLYVHSGAKPYKCGICKKAFARKDGLKSHGSVHSLVRPFRCSICNQSYKDARQRNHHERTTHSVLPKHGLN